MVKLIGEVFIVLWALTATIFGLVFWIKSRKCCDMQKDKGRQKEELQNQEQNRVQKLIGSMAEMMKNPMERVERGELLLANPAFSSEQRSEILKMIKEESAKINRPLQMLFTMMDFENGAVEMTLAESGIKNTLRNAVTAVYEKAKEKNIEIRMEDVQNVMLLYNPKWTAEVFICLLENAIRYSEENQSIEVTLDRQKNYGVVQIKDHGTGIRPEDIPYVFQCFYRGNSDNKVEGIGVGLYLSKLILEKENGYITVESEPGTGSVFSVFLPECGK